MAQLTTRLSNVFVTSTYFVVIGTSARRPLATSATARKRVSRFGIAGIARCGSSRGVSVGWAFQTLFGTFFIRVSSVTTRRAQREWRNAADLDHFDEQRLGLTSADAHGLPLQHVQTFGQLNALGAPFAFLRHAGPLGFIVAGYVLAQLVLSLKKKFIVRPPEAVHFN